MSHHLPWFTDFGSWTMVLGFLNNPVRRLKRSVPKTKNAKSQLKHQFTQKSFRLKQELSPANPTSPLEMLPALAPLFDSLDLNGVSGAFHPLNLANLTLKKLAAIHSAKTPDLRRFVLVRRLLISMNGCRFQAEKLIG